MSTFQCEYCLKISTSKHNLKIHQQTKKCREIQEKKGKSIDAQNVICEFCKREVISKTNLIKHQTICIEKINHEKLSEQKNEYEKKMNEQKNEYEKKMNDQKNEYEKKDE